MGVVLILFIVMNVYDRWKLFHLRFNPLETEKTYDVRHRVRIQSN